MPRPVRVRRVDRLSIDTPACSLDGPGIPEVEDKQRLRMWQRRAVVASTRELEMRVGSRQRKEDTVVPVVVVKAAELG